MNTFGKEHEDVSFQSVVAATPQKHAPAITPIQPAHVMQMIVDHGAIPGSKGFAVACTHPNRQGARIMHLKPQHMIVGASAGNNPSSSHVPDQAAFHPPEQISQRANQTMRMNEKPL